MTRTFTLDPTKTHVFEVDSSFMCLHTSCKIKTGVNIRIKDQQYLVKEVLKDQPSRYHERNTYYEIKI